MLAPAACVTISGILLHSMQSALADRRNGPDKPTGKIGILEEQRRARHRWKPYTAEYVAIPASRPGRVLFVSPTERVGMSVEVIDLPVPALPAAALAPAESPSARSPRRHCSGTRRWRSLGRRTARERLLLGDNYAARMAHRNPGHVWGRPRACPGDATRQSRVRRRKQRHLPGRRQVVRLLPQSATRRPRPRDRGALLRCHRVLGSVGGGQARADSGPRLTVLHHGSLRRPSIGPTAREPTGDLTRQELAELVQDAWLSRASAHRAATWLQAHPANGPTDEELPT